MNLYQLEVEYDRGSYREREIIYTFASNIQSARSKVQSALECRVINVYIFKNYKSLIFREV